MDVQGSVIKFCVAWQPFWLLRCVPVSGLCVNREHLQQQTNQDMDDCPAGGTTVQLEGRLSTIKFTLASKIT